MADPKEMETELGTRRSKKHFHHFKDRAHPHLEDLLS